MSDYRGVACSCGIHGDYWLIDRKLEVRERFFIEHRHTQRCTNEEPCAVKRILFAIAKRAASASWTIETKPLHHHGD